MIVKRIIPCLDIKDGRVVKGVRFEGLRDVEDPVVLARFYDDNQADEYCFRRGCRRTCLFEEMWRVFRA